MNHPCRMLSLALPLVLLLTGCDRGGAPGAGGGPSRAAAMATATPAPPPDPALLARIAAINAAVPGATMAAAASAPGGQPAMAAAAAVDPFAIRAQVLLARLRFSPGVVDGRPGGNFAHAVAAWQGAQDLRATGSVDAASWRALSAALTSAAPAAQAYTITPADVAGPFAPDVGEDLVKLAALPAGPQFATPQEALAERFHMSQALLAALNPGADFARAGTTIAVVAAQPAPFAKGDVARVDVAKADASVRAFDAAGALIAFYPATVGSTERPSPSGTHKVVGVSNHPKYTYDPAKLKWGPRRAGKLVVAPGPNSPVGIVWIDLDAPSYGLHGTPDPDHIGKTASHGCVRLTNWDARNLADGVRPGVVVRFVGQRG